MPDPQSKATPVAGWAFRSADGQYLASDGEQQLKNEHPVVICPRELWDEMRRRLKEDSPPGAWVRIREMMQLEQPQEASDA